MYIPNEAQKLVLERAKIPGFNDRKLACIDLILAYLRSLNREIFAQFQNQFLNHIRYNLFKSAFIISAMLFLGFLAFSPTKIEAKITGTEIARHHHDGGHHDHGRHGFGNVWFGTPYYYNYYRPSYYSPYDNYYDNYNNSFYDYYDDPYYFKNGGFRVIYQR